MNAGEGMRRIGIILGALGCVAGGVFGYWNLQKVWHSHTEFERLQSGPIIRDVAKAVKDYKDGKPLPTPAQPTEHGPWEKYQSVPNKIVLVDGIGNVSFPGDLSDDAIAAAIKRGLASGAGVMYFDILSQLLCESPAPATLVHNWDEHGKPIPPEFTNIRPIGCGGVGGESLVEAGKSNSLDRNAPGADDPEMEFTVDVQDTDGLKTVNVDKTGAVSSIHLNTGEWLRKQPKGLRAKLPFIGGLLFSLCLPLLGFLIPWGTIRVLVWVACGFSAPPS